MLQCGFLEVTTIDRENEEY